MAEPIWNVGFIYSGKTPLGTGTIVFLDILTMVLITAAHVLINPKTGEMFDLLWFYCGQHGNKLHAMWKGSITVVEVPNKYTNDKTFKYDFALAKIEIPAP